eukprot:1154540-Pyramimonas_sp.AAC.1
MEGRLGREMGHRRAWHRRRTAVRRRRRLRPPQDRMQQKDLGKARARLSDAAVRSYVRRPKLSWPRVSARARKSRARR